MGGAWKWWGPTHLCAPTCLRRKDGGCADRRAHANGGAGTREVVNEGGKGQQRGRGIVTSRNRSIHFLYFTPCLTFSLRLMVTHRLDSCDHLLYRLVTRYVPCLYCCRDSIVPCDLLSHVDGL